MVDLPDPEGPTSASVSPGATRKDTPFQDRPRGIVGEAHIVEHDLAAGHLSSGAPGLSATSRGCSSRSNISPMSTSDCRISR
jgi:hypothetical protein